MIQGLRKSLAKRLWRRLICMATQSLYTEQFDFEAIVRRLSRDQQGVALLHAYVAVQIAAQLTESVTDSDVERALDAVRLSELHSGSPVFEEIVDVHRELAELHWSRAQLAILRGKLAHKNDEYSYEGAIYEVQHSNKGPLTKPQRTKCESICKEMADLNRQVEEAELKALKEQDEEEYHRYKEELEVRSLRAEIDAHEDEAIALEGAEVLSMLEARLNELLQTGVCFE